MARKADPEKPEGRLHRLEHEIEEEVEHLVDGVRKRVRAAELGAMEGSPSSLLGAVDALEGAADPDHEAERVADQTEPRPPHTEG